MEGLYFWLFFFFFFLFLLLFCLHISGTLELHIARLNYSTDSLLQVRLLCALCFTTHPCLFFLKYSSRILSFQTTQWLPLTNAYLLNNNFKRCYNVMRRIYTLQQQTAVLSQVPGYKWQIWNSAVQIQHWISILILPSASQYPGISRQTAQLLCS